MTNARLAFMVLLAALPSAASCGGSAPAPGAAASIRGTDFSNFRYHFQRTTIALRDSAQEPVRRNGIIHESGYLLDGVVYGDVTGDGVEDAVVVVEEVTGGSAVPNRVFVYQAGADGPRRLWSFETGDRAAGGFKDVYVRDGVLVVELYGRDKVPSDPASLHRDDGTGSPACCPTMFTRSRYQWNGRAFVPRGAPEVLPYDPQAG
ncbi:MAG TPA: hypothetical protein VF006_30675 [Longimicrobium sp.]